MNYRRLVIWTWAIASVVFAGYVAYDTLHGCHRVNGQIYCPAPHGSDPDLSGNLSGALVLSAIFGFVPPAVIAALVAGIWFSVRDSRSRRKSN